MIKRLLILSMLIYPFYAQAGDTFFIERGNEIERDHFNEDRYNILSDESEKQGYIKRDQFSGDLYYIYDKNHKKVGKIRRDSFDKNRWRIEKKDD